jgi:hypothetical protein
MISRARRTGQRRHRVPIDVARCNAAMRHVLGMDWLGGYPTACHGAMFAASNSMNLRCSLASDFGVSQLGLAGHRLFRHEAVVRSAMKLVGRRSERGMLDRLVKAEMELAFAGSHHHRHRHLQDHRRPTQRTRPHEIAPPRCPKRRNATPRFRSRWNVLTRMEVKSWLKRSFNMS